MVSRQHAVIGSCPVRARSKTARQMSVRFEARPHQRTYYARLRTIVHICTIVLRLHSHIATFCTAANFTHFLHGPIWRKMYDITEELMKWKDLLK